MSGRATVVTWAGTAGGSRAAAAALACAAASPRQAALLLDLAGGGRSPRGALIAAAAAARLEESIARELPDSSPVARGQLCELRVGEVGAAAEAAAAADAPTVIHLPPALLQPALASPDLDVAAVLLRADLPQDRSLVALAARDLASRGVRVGVLRRPLGRLTALRATAGLLPPGGGLPARVLERLLNRSGQALPLVLGAALALVIAALGLVALAGAISGKGRVQRAADLVAVSAVRSMRDDLPRLLSPARLPDGRPNPRHLEKDVYLRRAREAAIGVARANGVPAADARIAFPDRASFAPLRARVRIVGELASGGGRVRILATATAEAVPDSAATRQPAIAAGGGYSGPLEYRQGEGMRPDVAAAFDRMAAAAARAGHPLLVNSAFRSDAEQAALFAAHPDPRWVAPPGRSLHRCATELDLGPPAAYSWLDANARRFGFVRRYSWEPWHFGFEGGPPPCSPVGELGHAGDGAIAAGGLPSFVPPRFREPLLAAAARWNVSASLLAAQLMAESNFNPFAVSPAGAQGIAQFMPSTAASYGLRDPFDPEAAIDAQAHLMSDLIARFDSPALALAAYNAGPAPVAACDCVPQIPETTAYVARILGLLGGAGAIASPRLEVRLVA